MKKILAIIISTVMLTGLLAVLSTALFTDAVEVPVSNIVTSSLDVSLAVECLYPESGIPVGYNYIPGDHKDYKITVTNEGDMEARWRLGMCPQNNNKSNDFKDIAFRNQIIITFYEPANDSFTEWTQIKSVNMVDFILPTTQPYPDDKWIYDIDLAGTGKYLQPGEKQVFLMQIDYDLPAEKNAQDGVFDCDLMLEGAQVNGEAWTLARP